MTTVSPKSQEYMGRQRWGSKDGEGLVKDTASSIVREPASVDAPATRQQVVGAVAFYCGCSSTLLFLNKLAVGGTTTLAPGAVVVVQIAVVVEVRPNRLVRVAKLFQLVSDFDPVKFSTTIHQQNVGRTTSVNVGVGPFNFQTRF